MANQHFERRDERNADLHAMVDSVDGFLAQLLATDAPRRSEALAGLRASWTELIKLLALEPLRELRECPSCGQIGMRAATRCGHCWAKLVPLAPLVPAGEPAVPTT